MDWDLMIREELHPLVPYPPGLREDQVQERCGSATIVKLSSNEHPAGPFPSAIAAITAELGCLNRYPEGSSEALRAKLSQRHNVPVDQVVVGAGSNELLRLVGQVVLRPGDEIVYAWPSFVVYPMVANIFGATHVKVPLAEGEVHDLEAMLAAITERTRIVFLCNPNNPTGTIVTREALESFLERVPDHVLLVLDEAYFEFATDAAYPDGLDYFDGERPLVVLRTFSKIYSLAGLRVGYGFAPARLVRAIDCVREPFNVSTVSQVAALASLDDEAEVLRRREENQEQKTYLYSGFDRLGISWVPSEANFVYIKTERPVEVFEALLAEGVIVRDFGNAPALRVTVGTPEESRRVVEAFEAVVTRLGAYSHAVGT
ncbi:MAG: histidinol-phosphate transaminase [Actinomycetota bacterium]|nr:histidinol-phosphate transaminase [Actinomycetota bacterium]